MANKKPEEKAEQKEIMPVENLNAVEVFSEGGLDKVLEKIEKEARSLIPDLTTDKGRKAIASTAYKVSQSKTYLDTLGKSLTEDWQKQTKKVNDERKKAREKLDTLRDDIRKPLNDWEVAEKERKQKALETIQCIVKAGEDAAHRYLEIPLEKMEQDLETLTQSYNFDNDEDFGDLAPRYHEVCKDAIGKMQLGIDARIKHDEQQAELDQLRKEKADREAKEEAERLRIEQEQAEAKKKEDERLEDERIKREKEEHDRSIAEEAKKEATRIAEKAIADKKAAEEKALAEKKAAEEREARLLEEKRVAEENARIEAERAVQAEKDRVEKQRLADLAEQEKRERNTRHKAAINNAAADALVKECKITPAEAKKIVKAIAQSKIPKVTISY